MIQKIFAFHKKKCNKCVKYWIVLRPSEPFFPKSNIHGDISLLVIILQFALQNNCMLLYLFLEKECIKTIQIWITKTLTNLVQFSRSKSHFWLFLYPLSKYKVLSLYHLRDVITEISHQKKRRNSKRRILELLCYKSSEW